MLQLNDSINGLFEVIGGCLLWLSVLKLYRDKKVAGVHWLPFVFYASWGYWNLYYYPSLNQWLSFVGGIVVVTSNTAWVILYVKYIVLKK